MSEQNDPEHNKASTANHTKVMCQSQIIWDELKENRSISLKRFKELCELPQNRAAKGASQELDQSEFSRAVQPIFVTLRNIGIKAELQKDNTLIVPNGLNLGEEGSSAFPPSDDDGDKRYIGKMVAKFLRNGEVCDLRDSVFLGSGSTIYHVGMQMLEWCKNTPTFHYPQLFSTTNVPLAALWCGHENPPSNKLSIPRGVLETRERRFETLQGDQEERHRWTPALAIVGADGCHYDKAHGKIWLYTKSESTAYNTNLFVNSATTTVLCCLASGKTSGRNNGPKLELPSSNTVVRGVVTGEAPLSKEIREAFEVEGYIIVENDDGFKKIKAANDKVANANKPTQQK